MNTEILLTRVKELCEKKGVNKTTAYTESGVGKNFGSNLKNANPSKKNLYLLAKYFDCSVEYLTGEIDEDNTVLQPAPISSLDEEEQFILDTFRKLSRPGKAKAYQTLLNLLDEEQIEQGKSAVVV